MDSFLLLEKDINVLEERPKCREAVGRMLELIAEIANNICNLSSSGVKGAIGFCCLSFHTNIPKDTFVTHEYQRRVDDFKDRFRKARQEFADSLQMEIIKGSIG